MNLSKFSLVSCDRSTTKNADTEVDKIDDIKDVTPSLTEYINKGNSSRLKFESQPTEETSDYLSASVTEENFNSYSLEFGSDLSQPQLCRQSLLPGRNFSSVEFESKSTEAAADSLSDSDTKENSPCMEFESKSISCSLTESGTPKNSLSLQFESKKPESFSDSLIEPVIDRNSASLEFESKSTSDLLTESVTKNSPSLEFESQSTNAASRFADRACYQEEVC